MKKKKHQKNEQIEKVICKVRSDELTNAHHIELIESLKV